MPPVRPRACSPAAPGCDTPPARPLAGSRSLALVVLLAVAATGCRSEASSPLAERFHRVSVVRVSPIEPFAHSPVLVAVLPDGRMVLPEADGEWIHVVGADGQGITRLGGPGPASPESEAAPGTFRALSDLARLPDGRLLASDRASSSLTVFTAALEPAGTIRVPGAAGVYAIRSLPDGRLVAAVRPRNLVTGGQVVVFAPGDSGPGFLPPDPLFQHNRWEAAASPSIEVWRADRILAYWAPIPWAKVLSPEGDSLGVIGRLSALYRGPSSGPRPRAPLESVQRWFDGFTPLVAVESVGDLLVFEYRASTRERRRAVGRAAEPESVAAASRPEPLPGQMFLNLYGPSGRAVARDLLLPPGSHLLRSDDRRRLYLLTRSSPRELEIEIWEPRSRAS